jgi:hypothetical protein
MVGGSGESQGHDRLLVENDGGGAMSWYLERETS